MGEFSVDSQNFLVVKKANFAASSPDVSAINSLANSGATAITTSKGPTPPPPVIISNPARPTVIQPFIRPSADELTRAKSKLKSSKKNLVETEREDSNIANQTWREIRKEIPKETLVEIKRILDNLPHAPVPADQEFKINYK